MFAMTPTILRNFFAKGATRRYPHSVRPAFAKARGAISNDIAICVLCGICAARCPSQCIVVDKKNATWQYDPFACIYCGVCVEACKTGSLHQEPLYRPATPAREIVLLRRAADKKDEEL